MPNFLTESILCKGLVLIPLTVYVRRWDSSTSLHNEDVSVLSGKWVREIMTAENQLDPVY